MKKVIKICAWAIAIIAIACVALMLLCNQIVVNNAEGKVFSDIDSIKYNKVGLLLGTTPQSRFDRITNYFFIYRIDAAEQLYKAGKIEQILISGDENSLDGINEPECMRDSLVARGVPVNFEHLLITSDSRTPHSGTPECGKRKLNPKERRFRNNVIVFCVFPAL